MKNKIFFFTFMSIWGLLVVMNLIIPKVTFSEKENRVLAKIPSFSMEKLIDGSYAQGLDAYVNDHFVLRDTWMNLQAIAEITTLKDEINGIYYGKDGYLFAKFDYQKEEIDNLKMIEERVNTFAHNSHFNTYFMLVPNSIAINQAKLPDHLVVKDQSAIIKDFYANLNNVETINVVNALKERQDEKLYFKTDHHMTSLGAYYTYQEFCQKAGIVPINLEEMQKIVVTNDFLGTADSKANIPFTKGETIEIYVNDKNTNLKSVEYDTITTQSIFDRAYLEKKDKYSFFLNGNNAKVVVKTNVTNGKKLLVVKDSYANNMAQFLCNHYEEIHFIDPRYYKMSISEYAAQNEIQDVLFLYNVSNLVSDLGLRTLK